MDQLLGLAENALWILGYALALAALSYAHWAANATHTQLPSHQQGQKVAHQISVNGIPDDTDYQTAWLFTPSFSAMCTLQLSTVLTLMLNFR